MNKPTPHDRLLARQASEWMQTLARADGAGHAAFVAWLKESPRNVREYLLTVALDEALAGMDRERRHDVRALLEDARADNLVALNGVTGAAPQPVHAPLQAPRRQRRSTAWAVAAAASLAMMAITLAALWWIASPLGGEEYLTGVGEQRTVRLADGSLVQINTRSRLAVRYSDNGRDLTLLQGEALFQVARDPARPFRVAAGAAVVQALGTQFNIHRGERATTVSVLEGVVQISSGAAASPAAGTAPTSQPARDQIASSGEEVRIAEGGIVAREALDPARVTAWRERRLVFRSERLADIAAEFNRYNHRPRLRLEGPDVAERRYTGTFDADDPGSLALLLSEEGDLVVELGRGEEILVRGR
jgi:transmembrane sensor